MKDNPNENSVTKAIRRGLGYTITAVLTVIAGLFIFNAIDFSNIIIACGLAIMGVPFYVKYAVRYENTDNNTGKDAILLTTIIIILLEAIAILILHSSKYNVITLIPMYGMHAILHILLFYLGFNRKIKYKIRFWLIMPVLSSISLSLIGSWFTSMLPDINNILLYSPYLLLLIYFIIARFFKEKNLYLILTIVMLLIVAVIYIISCSFKSEISKKIDEVYSVLIISIVLSAFLASFEAWKLTRQKMDNGSRDGFSFYKSTNYAMIISLLLLPVFLIMHYFNLLFYAVLIPLGIISCLFWINYGVKKKYEGKWASLKSLIGYIIIGVMVVDSILKLQLPNFLLSFV